MLHHCDEHIEVPKEKEKDKDKGKEPENHDERGGQG
jgi:hypothetical protein